MLPTAERTAAPAPSPLGREGCAPDGTGSTNRIGPDLVAAFCTEPFVPRILRVAIAFAARTASSDDVAFARAFLGFSPNFASCRAGLPAEEGDRRRLQREA